MSVQRDFFVVNNIVMEDERAQVIQVSNMLRGFVDAGASPRYLWPSYGKQCSLLTLSGADLLPVHCHFRHGIARYAEFMVRLAVMLWSLPAWPVFTRSLPVAIMAARFSPCTVLELHDPPTRAQKAILRMLPDTVRIVCNSGGTAWQFTKQGIPAERMTVLHNSVDYERFASATSLPMDRKPMPSRKCRVNHLYVGALKPERGLDLILHAARTLADHGFVLVGAEGGDEGIAIDLPNVLVHPRIPWADVPSLLVSYDTLLAPYRSDLKTRETMSPLKLFEYLASGVPVVISDIGPVREVVGDDGAWLFNPDDPDSFVRALVDSSRGGGSREKASKGQEIVKNKFSRASRVTNLLQLIQNY